VILLLESLLLPLPVSADDELRQAALRNMLRKSDRLLPPQAEEDEAAVEGEQDADDDAVCRSIPADHVRAGARRGPRRSAAADHRQSRDETPGRGTDGRN